MMSQEFIESILNGLGYSEKEYGYNDETRNPQYYHYIACHNYEWVAEMYSKYFRVGDNFVDVGCGLGEKLALAYIISNGKLHSITGIEYNNNFLTIAKYIAEKNGLSYERPKIKFVWEDALSTDYSKYSFIYMFHPICDQKLYSKLIKRIKETSSDDTIVMEALHYFRDEELCIVSNTRAAKIVAKKVNGVFVELKEDK